jgi:hypothetical protein
MTKQLCIFCREDGEGLTALHIDGQPARRMGAC